MSVTQHFCLGHSKNSMAPQLSYSLISILFRDHLKSQLCHNWSLTRHVLNFLEHLMCMKMIHCHEIWPCSSHAKRPKSLCRISWPWIILMTVRRPKKKDFCFSSLACDIILTYFGPWRELKLVNNSAGVPLTFLSGPGKNAVSLTFLDQIGHRLERLLSLCGARHDQKISSLSWLQIALWRFEKNSRFCDSPFRSTSGRTQN